MTELLVLFIWNELYRKESVGRHNIKFHTSWNHISLENATKKQQPALSMSALKPDNNVNSELNWN